VRRAKNEEAGAACKHRPMRLGRMPAMALCECERRKEGGRRGDREVKMSMCAEMCSNVKVRGQIRCVALPPFPARELRHRIVCGNLGWI